MTGYWARPRLELLWHLVQGHRGPPGTETSWESPRDAASVSDLGRTLLVPPGPSLGSSLTLSLGEGAKRTERKRLPGFSSRATAPRPAAAGVARAMGKGEEEPRAAESPPSSSPLNVYLIGLDSLVAFDYISKGPEEFRSYCRRFRGARARPRSQPWQL